MGHTGPSPIRRHTRNAEALRQPSCPGHVGLDHIDVTPVDQLRELPPRRVLLARRDADIRTVGQPRVLLQRVGQERLFDPKGPKLAKEAGTFDGVGPLPPEPEVQQEVYPGPHCPPGGADQGRIALEPPSESPPAPLDSSQASRTPPLPLAARFLHR